MANSVSEGLWPLRKLRRLHSPFILYHDLHVFVLAVLRSRCSRGDCSSPSYLHRFWQVSVGLPPTEPYLIFHIQTRKTPPNLKLCACRDTVFRAIPMSHSERHSMLQASQHTFTFCLDSTTREPAHSIYTMSSPPHQWPCLVLQDSPIPLSSPSTSNCSPVLPSTPLPVTLAKLCSTNSPTLHRPTPLFHSITLDLS